MNSILRRKYIAFTLIELMITVAIIAILSAIAIPVYENYIRRSYLSEATSSISSIKSAEESFYTLNGCYIEAEADPTSVPSGSKTIWDTSILGWGNNALAVRPDKYVRFQYQVYATNSLSGSGCGTATHNVSAVNTALNPPSNPCVTAAVGSGNSFLVDTSFNSNWYIAVARGDLDGDGTDSLIVSAIDDSAVIECNELE